MWKPVLACTTAVVIAGTSFAVAQHRPGRPDGARRWQPNLEDMRAFDEARLAGLKAGLALTSEQEKNWPAFEQAARDLQKLRIDHMSAVIQSRKAEERRLDSLPQRLEQRATAMMETSAALKKLADATTPLYGALDDAQKRRFGLLARSAAANSFATPHFRMRDNGPGRSERGYRRTDLDDHNAPSSRALGTPLTGQEKL